MLSSQLDLLAPPLRSLSFPLILFFSAGNDRRSRPGWRWGSEPAGVSAHYEENLPVLKQVNAIRVGDVKGTLLLIYLSRKKKKVKTYYCIVLCQTFNLHI